MKIFNYKQLRRRCYYDMGRAENKASILGAVGVLHLSTDLGTTLGFILCLTG